MENLYLSKVVHVGNSKYVNIPVDILRALHIQRGDYLIMAVYDTGTIVMRKPSDQEIRNLKPFNIKYGHTNPNV